VHPRAIVDSGAILEDDVEVGPNAVIEAGATAPRNFTPSTAARPQNPCFSGWATFA
jgi:acyl-[acyl carrier protein]--UDP-N-acetylglucosamine O-acyltransferase